MTIEQQSPTSVFGTVAELLRELVGDVDVLGIEITPQTTFHEDLGLESIDLVTFASILAEFFGEDVNLAEFLAEKDLDDVIGLRVGDIADYVAARLGERG
ncbi:MULTISPECIES: phosphopantetheine-binding protein [Amycolatopsis]|uniref:Acyl carrier protein n=1 Tax=Amycolatopsis azurea DSM 43854 TaxID=1238180 RepID=M2Q6I4_9PSEU|nr:phosphopantetheine-binding protein [Amycolatopsis azurea]EMD22351.1 putative acyl carrier protein [Amycolatopsis azurea DSM 43854]OOC01236.1 acyl carrier protein [Amycolatopsis azurea DSM 43854]